MIKIATKKKLFSARVSELARLESAAALAVCGSVAALLQLCCSSVAALQSRVSELARILMISDSLFAVRSDKT
jgi:hypothetical protein